MWSGTVKDKLHQCRAERANTKRMCTRLMNLLREASNEIWQHANIATNAMTASVERIRRERTVYLDKLSLVRD